MVETLYILGNHLGGITSLCANLVRNRPEGAGRQSVILLTDALDTLTRAMRPLGADREIVFDYSRQDNFYRVLERLAKSIAAGRGPVISNSACELAVFSRYDVRRTVFQIVHDAYNLSLAQRFEPVVDVMIAHSRHFFEELVKALPHRKDSIFYLPYGIPLAQMRRRRNGMGVLHLVFLGRLDVGKGVHDLPKIDQLLRQASVSVRWTIIGNGPERARLVETMPASERVRYATPQTNGEVLALCAEGDVFVFPTRFEGFPVALLEAMSAGLVPVASDLPSGIPEVVDASTGFRIPVGDVKAFAAAIARLDRDRTLLERKSIAARERAQGFDVAVRAAEYHQLFARWAELKRPWSGPLPMKHGSRLDQPYLPNSFVRATRQILGHLTSLANRKSAS